MTPHTTSPFPIHSVAIVVDAWFPKGHKGFGVIGGHQVHVRELTKELKQAYGIETTLFYPAHANRVYRFIWIAIAMYRILEHHRRQPFELIHAHGLIAGIIASRVGKILGIPTVQTVHGTPHMDMKAKTVQAWLEKVSCTQTEYTAQIAVTSTFTKYPNRNQSITVIPNGVNTDEFDDVEVEKNEDPTLIWVGKNDRSKGLAYLKQAIVKVRKKYPTLKAKLITGGQTTGKALIKDYKRSHLFVLPSLAEGQPITLLEAWAAKLPVVVTDVGENSTMVKDGVNGYVVEPGNVMQLTNAILKVLRARTKNTQMGERGYTLVKQEYTWKKVAERTGHVYKYAASKK